MDKGYESILKCLEENEKIIFTTDKNFKFGEKNLLVTGEKYFCISNLGKIYIADKNRRLKAIKVNKYDYKEKGIKFNVLNKENIIAINSRDFTDNRSESFIINMKLNDFTEISKKLLNNPFVYEWSKYSVKFDEGIYESALITYEEDYISIDTINNKINLRYMDIIDFKEKDKSLHIISNSKEVYNILIYAFNKDITNISKTIENAKQGVEEKFDKKNNQDFENAKTMVLDTPIDATIIDIDGSFREELDRTISNYYKNELENELENHKSINQDTNINSVNEKQDIIMNSVEEEEIILNEEPIKIEKIVDIQIKKPEFNVELKKYDGRSYGKLYGTLNSINYKGRQAEVIIDDELKLLDKELNKELISIPFDGCKYTKNDTIIIFEKNENMILINLEEQDLSLDDLMINCIANTEYIGYTSELQPFRVKFIENEMILEQSEKSFVKKIAISEIADINLLEENLNFESVAITLKNSEIYKIFVMRASVKNILRDIYRLKSFEKYIECDKNVKMNTFKNMIKDELSILYFGDIIKIKNMIDDFYKSNVKNKKVLIENIYNTIQKIEKSNKLITMYYFEKFNIEIDFKMLKVIQEMEIVEDEVLDLTNHISLLLNDLQVIKNISNRDEIEMALNNDMYYILEKIGLKIDDYKYETITLTREITEYNFDNILNKISKEINGFLSVKTMYYSKLIKAVIDELKLETHLSQDELVDSLIEHFVRMQLKSKIDNKTRLKDVLLNIKKYISMKQNTDLNVIDILNLVSF